MYTPLLDELSLVFCSAIEYYVKSFHSLSLSSVSSESTFCVSTFWLSRCSRSPSASSSSNESSDYSIEFYCIMCLNYPLLLDMSICDTLEFVYSTNSLPLKVDYVRKNLLFYFLKVVENILLTVFRFLFEFLTD